MSVTVKTNKLEGAPLDWVVGKLLGYNVARTDYGNLVDQEEIFFREKVWNDNGTVKFYQSNPWAPSSDWSQGGPLLDEYSIDFRKMSGGSYHAVCDAIAATGKAYGNTRLVACMRALVVALAGDEVRLPVDIVELLPRINGIK